MLRTAALLCVRSVVPPTRAAMSLEWSNVLPTHCRRERHFSRERQAPLAGPLALALLEKGPGPVVAVDVRPERRALHALPPHLLRVVGLVDLGRQELEDRELSVKSSTFFYALLNASGKAFEPARLPLLMGWHYSKIASEYTAEHWCGEK